jgi:hypothetical protein
VKEEMLVDELLYGPNGQIVFADVLAVR